MAHYDRQREVSNSFVISQVMLDKHLLEQEMALLKAEIKLLKSLLAPATTRCEHYFDGTACSDCKEII